MNVAHCSWAADSDFLHSLAGRNPETLLLSKVKIFLDDGSNTA